MSLALARFWWRTLKLPPVRARSDKDLKRYIENAVEVDPDRPVLVDKYLDRADELDVDALCDKDGNVVICGIMQHIEQAGVHSGAPPLRHIMLMVKAFSALRGRTIISVLPMQVADLFGRTPVRRSADLVHERWWAASQCIDLPEVVHRSKLGSRMRMHDMIIV